MNSKPQIKVGIEKYDDDFLIPYDESMTLERFKTALEKAIGSPCKLNTTKYEKNKKQTMKDFVEKNGNNIFLLENDNLGSFIKHWKGNFINKNNSCFKDSFVQSLVHSMTEAIVKREEELRKKQGLPIAKDFKSYNNGNNSDSNNFYADLLYLLDNIKDKMNKKDSSPMQNTYDPTHIAKDQKYSTGGGYATDNTAKLSRSSTSTSTGSCLNGGSLSAFFKNKYFYTTFVEDHEIFLKEKTVVSDCIRFDVRNFKECNKCHFSDISVINPGNIVIPMYDYIMNQGMFSFDRLLQYYYKINNFGKQNSKSGEFCNKCNSYNLNYYNKMSTLPDILIIDFNLEKYYIYASDYRLKNDRFCWLLEEQISLSDHYDRIDYDSSSKDDCYYELTSFIGHFGEREHGHFINFSKVDDKWYLFDDLRENSVEMGDFLIVKSYIEKNEFSFRYSDGKNEVKTVSSKLKICTCFYERNICKGDEQYIRDIKKIIKRL